ncbi:MAG: sensor histidine kinase, partial [Anaeromyxobacteraceae bacterium]
SGDASRLGQVVSNLVGNALDHGGEMGEASVEVWGEEDAVRIAVHNEGPEIPTDLLPTLFEPFRRLARGDGEGSRSAHLGLGLFIVSEIARAHGGTVAVASAPGEGTTVTVTLPRSSSGA